MSEPAAHLHGVFDLLERHPRYESHGSFAKRHVARRGITTALLLAAGTGSRLKPFTDTVPKCLVEVNGVPILGWLVRRLAKQGFKRLIVAVGYLGWRIRKYLELNASGLTIDFVDCPEYATTSNLYSLWLAREQIREPFVLIESDLVFDSRLLSAMRVPGRIAVARFRASMNGTTVSLDESGRVTSFHVGADPGARNFSYKTVNVYSLSLPTWREVLRRMERRITADAVCEYYEVVFAEMVADNRLAFHAVHFDEGRWCEIDTCEDLRLAKDLFSRPWEPWQSLLADRLLPRDN